MDRRSFVQGMGGATMLSAFAGAAQGQGSGSKTRIYRLFIAYMRQGDQIARMNDFLASQLPLFKKMSSSPVGIFTAFLGPHIPALVAISGHRSLAEMETTGEQIRNESGYRKALAAAEKGAEPPYDHAEVRLLAAMDYSPEIVPLKEKPKPSRIFELRVYHSPTQWQLKALHERFSGAEVKIFHRCGIHPVLYSSTLAGPNMPNLTYLMPFATLADREKAWDAFGADPDWIKVRKESIDRSGQITNQISITLLRPTDYSPIQ